MAVGAVIENGKIMESAAEKSVKSTASNKNGMDTREKARRYHW